MELRDVVLIVITPLALAFGSLVGSFRNRVALQIFTDGLLFAYARVPQRLAVSSDGVSHHGEQHRRAAARLVTRMPKQSPVLMFVTSIAGLAVSVLSGLALVPRVRFVEILTVIAGALGGGAAFAVSIIQFRQGRKKPARSLSEARVDDAAEDRAE